MSKKKPYNPSVYQRKHYTQTEQFVQDVQALYDQAIKQIMQLPFTPDPDSLFSFSDYPPLNKRAEAILNQLTAGVSAKIISGVEAGWNLANTSNDALVESVLERSALTKAELTSYSNRNLSALDSFKTRKIDGLNLSQRVYKYNKDFKTEIENAIDLGIGEGKSAVALTRDVRDQVKTGRFQKGFRRVRDAEGNLKLSRRSASYHPGQGVYRSATKNAERFTRTEINSAYKTADMLRYQKLDFVVGIEVKLSNNPNHCPTCEALAGQYPKWFKFVGWHPQCRCFTITILKTKEELSRDRVARLNDEPVSNQSVNTVSKVPSNFTSWINDNKDRVIGYKNTPWFIRDNFKDGVIGKGLVR